MVGGAQVWTRVANKRKRVQTPSFLLTHTSSNLLSAPTSVNELRNSQEQYLYVKLIPTDGKPSPCHSHISGWLIHKTQVSCNRSARFHGWSWIHCTWGYACPPELQCAPACRCLSPASSPRTAHTTTMHVTKHTPPPPLATTLWTVRPLSVQPLPPPLPRVPPLPLVAAVVTCAPCRPPPLYGCRADSLSVGRVLIWRRDQITTTKGTGGLCGTTDRTPSGARRARESWISVPEGTHTQDTREHT